VRDWIFDVLQAALEGRYALLQAVGHGAMATVYRAHDLRHDREVAIKALRLTTPDAAASERFLREIRFLARLQHPNILPLFDSGEAQGIPYFVTAFVEGMSLRDALREAEGNRLPAALVVRFVRETADALDFAHRRNVLHRDIKPENILLHADHAIVADFGIARAIRMADESSLTDTGVAIGTPAYMSPEQLSADRQLDARSDTYALACVAYEALAGAPPFLGPRRVVDNVLKFTHPPRSLRHYVEELPERLDHVLGKALAADPEQRYEKAGDFAEALQREMR